MKFKSLAVAISLLVIVACAGVTKPPVPPVPPVPVCDPNVICGLTNACAPPNCQTQLPPHEHGFCGDGTCGPAENSTNCKRDCPNTSCSSELQCGSVGACNPPNCKPASTELIKRDFTTVRILGNYVGAYGQPDFDWEAYFKLFKLSLVDADGKCIEKGCDWRGFNFSKHFILDTWNNKEFWPWKVVNGVVDLKQPNPEFWKKFDESLAMADKFDVGMDLCFFTDYGNEKWQKYKGIAKTYPFRKNTEHSNVADGDPPGLYFNWNRRLPVKQNSALFAWKEDDEYNIEFYKETSPSGRALKELMETSADHIAVQAKKPGSRLRVQIRTANEPFGVVESDGKTFIREKGKLLDDRTENLVIETFKDRGFKVGDRFRFVSENETYIGNVSGAKAMYWPDKTMKMYTKPRGYLMEWHGICELSEKDPKTKLVVGGQEFFTKIHGYDTEYFVGSSDGCKEDNVYFKNMTVIAKTKPKHFDYKVWACYKKDASCPIPWMDFNMNSNVKVFVPMMEKELFK